LGNVGGVDRRERHSLGARVVCAVAAARGATAEALDGRPGAPAGLWRSPLAEDREAILVPPQGLINDSGPALRAALTAAGEADAPFLAVVDDCMLPLGALRLRSTGTSGGHRGLDSLEEAYGHKDYHRLRIGVGGKPTKDFVTGAFTEAEEAVLGPTVVAASRAVETWLTWGPGASQRVMAIVNAPGFLQGSDGVATPSATPAVAAMPLTSPAEATAPLATPVAAALSEGDAAAADHKTASPPKGQPVVLGFDLDDTLWDTAATLRAAHEAMVKAAPGLPLPQQAPAGFGAEMAATKAEHPSRSHDFTFLRKETLRRLLKSDELVEAAFAAWFAARNAPKFFPGAIEALHTLQASGHRLCAISDGNAKPMDIPELKGVFDFAVSAEEAGAPKPDARPFHLASEKAGVPCASMVYVGDNYEKDIIGAKAAGMRAVWVRKASEADPVWSLEPRKAPPAVRDAADAEVESVSELPKALRSML